MSSRNIIITSLIVIIVLLVAVMAAGFYLLVQLQQQNVQAYNEPTIAPTFTATPTPTIVIVTNTPAVQTTATAIAQSQTPTAEATDVDATTSASATPTRTTEPTSTPRIPQVVAQTIVNVRSGPGLNFTAIDALAPNQPVPMRGRNEAGTWWLIDAPSGGQGWVSDSVVSVRNGTDVPIIPTPTAPPQPSPTITLTPTPSEPTPTPKPQYQYEPTGWFGDTNLGLTRFLGSISDANGNPVNGVEVEAMCGSYKVISNPSGPVGAGFFNESADWPPGFYDITVDTRPVPCKWFLTVVQTDGNGNVVAQLSENVEVEVTVDTSIITANWRKNW